MPVPVPAGPCGVTSSPCCRSEGKGPGEGVLPAAVPRSRPPLPAARPGTGTTAPSMHCWEGHTPPGPAASNRASAVCCLPGWSRSLSLQQEPPAGPAAREGWSRAAAVEGPPRPQASGYRRAENGRGRGRGRGGHAAPRCRWSGAASPVSAPSRRAPASRRSRERAEAPAGRGGPACPPLPSAVGTACGSESGRGSRLPPSAPGSPGVPVTQRGTGSSEKGHQRVRSCVGSSA